MSDNKVPVPKQIDPELIEKVSGGSCTPEEWAQFAGELKDTYETLIDFTSYVIERVVTSSTN